MTGVALGCTVVELANMYKSHTLPTLNYTFVRRVKQYKYCTLRPSMHNHRYFLLNKPYDMVSQFVSPDKVNLLGIIDFDFPEGTHAIGRLDRESEGLLLLTTNKRVTKLLFESKTPHKRTYLVLVKNVVSPETLQQLRQGIPIKIEGGEMYTGAPCQVDIVDKPANLFPGRYDNHHPYPHTWLSITLTEGKFHQVRKMVKAAHHRCQRLIRMSIEDMQLGDIQPGEIKEVGEEEFFRLLRINYI